jgi:FlaA1/EpsC-like NDP-sugar epimerase
MISLEHPALPSLLLGRSEDRFTFDISAWRRKRILITGAAGSIGQALVHKLAALMPERIVALDNSETLLTELIRRFPPDRLRLLAPELADVGDHASMDSLLSQYRPDVVLHAAALKHVPVLEHFAFEAIEVNTLATLRLARLAQRHGVARFLFVSTDKAVDPTSIMGASKRLAELALLAEPCANTRFASFRCGNVLASSGSVLPIWFERIAAALPLPLTALEAERYFISLQEAASALLLTTTLASDLALFSYALHEPVRLTRLAERLFVALNVSRCPEFRITGLLPGEKLREALHYREEQLQPTWSPYISGVRSAEHRLPFGCEGLSKTTGVLSRLLETRDLRGLIRFLQSAIPTYEPSSAITKQLTS